MLRAGMIKRLAAGIYTWLPLGLRVLRKVEAIVREEMNRAGAHRAADAGRAAGRAAGRRRAAGASTGRSCCASRTVTSATSSSSRPHEEVITDIARKDLKSYRQLPINFYQIQTKFRDEVRPRFGVMRCARVRDEGRLLVRRRPRRDARSQYQAMYDAYTRIFTRMGLTFRAVAADTGAIGGSASHEFQVLADSGEDAIAWCRASDYAANVELAEAIAPARAAPRAGRADAEGADAGPRDLRGRRRAARAPARAHRQVHHARDRHRGRAAAHLDAADPRRPRVERGQGRARSPGLEKFRWASEAEIVAATGCAARLPRAGRHPEGAAADRRSHGRRDGRFRLRRERGRLPPARRQLRSRLPRARPGRRRAQRRRGRSLARRQGHARDPARHRGRSRVRARHPLFAGHGCNLSRRAGSEPADRDGLLRHRHHARRRRRDRAEPRREGHRLAAAARAVRGGDRAGGLRPQRGGPDACRPAPRRARVGGDRGAARRPRRASWRDVCRPGVDRHPAPHYDRRARPEGRQRRIPGAQRRRRRARGPAAVPVTEIGAFIRGTLSA